MAASCTCPAALQSLDDGGVVEVPAWLDLQLLFSLAASSSLSRDEIELFSVEAYLELPEQAASMWLN